MWDMFSSSFRLFFKGKLFRDPREVVRRWLIGVVVSFLVLVGLSKLGLPLGVAVVIASLAAGLLQPWLFKDLRYA
jgi:hypothetical protein